MALPGPFPVVATTATPGLNFQKLPNIILVTQLVANFVTDVNQQANGDYTFAYENLKSVQYAEFVDHDFLIEMDGTFSTTANGNTKKHQCEYQARSDIINVAHPFKSLYYKCDGVDPVVAMGYKITNVQFTIIEIKD